jgi:hypothetical protein
MWIKCRSEQTVRKQEMHTEFCLEGLMKTPLAKAESMEGSYKTDLR